MVEQVTFQTIFQFLQTIGILVGVYYYVMTIRANRRNQEIAIKAQQQVIETRQLDLFLRLYERMSSREAWTVFQEIQTEWSWDGFEDFWQKYGEENNPGAWSTFLTTCADYEQIGHLVRDGLIDPKRVWDYFGFFMINFWEKILPVVEGYREMINDETFLEWFEDLYYILINLRENENMLLKERVARRKKHRANLNI